MVLLKHLPKTIAEGVVLASFTVKFVDSFLLAPDRNSPIDVVNPESGMKSTTPVNSVFEFTEGKRIVVPIKELLCPSLSSLIRFLPAYPPESHVCFIDALLEGVSLGPPISHEPGHAVPLGYKAGKGG